MADGTIILPSKVIQIDNDLALCADGSVWAINDARTTPYSWVCIHPPHEPPAQAGNIAAMRHDRQLTDDEIKRIVNPPTQAADLAEALEVLRNIIETDCELYCPTEIEIRQAYEAAEALLKKHGINPQQDKRTNEDDDEDPGTPFTEEDLRKCN